MTKNLQFQKWKPLTIIRQRTLSTSQNTDTARSCSSVSCMYCSLTGQNWVNPKWTKNSTLSLDKVEGVAHLHDEQLPKKWNFKTKIENKSTIKFSTLAGLEPTRNYSNRFLVDRLNHSATVSDVWLDATGPTSFFIIICIVLNRTTLQVRTIILYYHSCLPTLPILRKILFSLIYFQQYLFVSSIVQFYFDIPVHCTKLTQTHYFLLNSFCLTFDKNL